jgi:DNA-binding response OmpR family regulator
MPKVLLVEDDPMIAEIYIKKMQAADLEVINAKTGKEALKAVENDKFDLMLLDMVIPELSGMEVLKEIKHSGNYDKNLRIVIFSNLNETDTQKEALENGADGFIGKTQYTPTEMVAEVQRLINEFAEQDKNKKRLNDGGGACQNGKRILFIEDEEIFLEMFGKKLEDDGYCLTYANNGAWGVKEALENNYDLIVTDMVMPAMGGMEIVSKLKQDDKTKDVPIIVISASVSEEDENAVKELGIEDFFLKTRIVPSDLARKVGEIIKK